MNKSFVKSVHSFRLLNEPMTQKKISPFWWMSLNRRVPSKVHYMEKNPGMFSSKTLISFRLKKERDGHLGWHGGE